MNCAERQEGVKMENIISMKLQHWLCFILLFGVLGSYQVDAAPSSPPSKGEPISSVVDLGYTKYQGTVLKAGVNQYLGMRYAAPPLGNLRWRAPQDPLKEDGVQDAFQFAPTCVGSGESISSSDNLSEDCLFLDVFTPSNATTDSKLPVWFFIQGGGYAANSDKNFNGTEVIQKSGYNIVFVELNYRVGAFGFLASEKIRKDGDLNVGLLDQRKALEWVQKYIHLFGGDPEHVVIHGDSAGGGSVAFQLTAYGGKGDPLFVGAIPQSPFLPTHRSVKESEFQFNRFVSDAGCSDAHDQLACLRSLDTASLEPADVISTFPGAPKNVDPNWYFLPVVDGTFSPDYLYKMFEKGRLHKVPVIVGDDTDEGTYFAPNATSSKEFLDFIDANYPHLNAGQLQSIKKAYPLGRLFPKHASWFTPAANAYGESTFTCPGIEITEAYARYTSPSQSWNYRYNVYDASLADQGLGVPHVTEKPALYGPGMAGPCDDCSYLTYNKNIIPVYMNYYISFIRSLDPNTHKYPEAPEWEPWGAEGGQRLLFETNATRMETVPNDQMARCAMWKRLVPITEQ